MKMPKKFRRRMLPVLCYLVALAGWLVWGLWGMAADGLDRASGRMTQQELAPADFALVDLEQTGEDTLVTTSGDPQMILEDVSDRTVRTLQIWADYDNPAREMCLYYTTQEGQPYSQDRRVFPRQQADGSYLYQLPRGRIVSLRLDPCSPDQDKTVTITVHRIALNTNASANLLPNWYQTFCLILYPGLAAAVLDWGLGLAAGIFSRKKETP